VAVGLFALSLLAGRATGAGGTPASRGEAGGPVSALGEVR
jgi:hypothetical protein